MDTEARRKCEYVRYADIDLPVKRGDDCRCMSQQIRGNTNTPEEIRSIRTCFGIKIKTHTNGGDSKDPITRVSGGASERTSTFD